MKHVFVVSWHGYDEYMIIGVFLKRKSAEIVFESIDRSAMDAGWLELRQMELDRSYVVQLTKPWSIDADFLRQERTG